jgi:cyclic beta-1,2-glucan synthetase
MVRCALRRLLPGTPAAALDMLSVTRGVLEQPIRAEIFGAQRFAQHGRSLGLTHHAVPARLTGPSFFPRLQANIDTLREAHRSIGKQACVGDDISPAAEWLLDNFHLIEAQLEAVRAGLPRSYFRALPVLVNEPLSGLPRVYGVAWAFVAHTDGAFDDKLLAQFLSAYQETRALNLGEMWALPTTLRVVLIENLRRLAERVASHQAARELANTVCDQLGRYGVPQLDALLALLAERGVARVFLGQMAQRLHAADSWIDSPHPAQQAWLHRQLPDSASVQVQQQADQTASNLSVSNAVRSLRAIGDADWADIVGRSSTLMQLMLSWPLFAAEHTSTRDQTLHRIEQWARRHGRSEVAVAQALLGLLQQGEHLASHWLAGPGRGALRAALRLPPQRMLPWARAALPGYLGLIALGTLALVLLLLGPAWQQAPLWQRGLVLLLMLLPASEAVIALVNRLISESAHPRPLPRLSLAAGVPAEQRVMVVIPALLSSHDTVHELVHRLRLHHLANPELHTQFALLSDWTDAANATLPSDAALLASAQEGVAALNAKYPPQGSDAAPRFIVLHRPRRFSDSEQAWIGWERKRGKLEQLMALLAGAGGEDFLDLGRQSLIAPGTVHVLTLDSDTQLPPGRLRELIGVAAHPANQPRLSADGQHVHSGYGVLQPRIVLPLPRPDQLTAYHWLFAGQPGIDPYSNTSSEVYQDLFGQGSFTGKGLLHVQTMHRVLHGRLPREQVLSHDLLEGSLLRCAAVSDVTLIEDAPFHADVGASRVHRWTRGDWQLLPLLATLPLGALARWKMLDNLRRSLVAPAAVLLLLLALATPLVAPAAALTLVLAALAAGPLMGAVAGFVPSRRTIAKWHFYRQALLDLARAALGAVWLLAQLLQRALQALDAITRALWRMFVSRRHLLQWTTAAAAQAGARTTLGAVWRKHAHETALALLLAAGLWALDARLVWVLPLVLLWAASPLWTWLVSRPRHNSAAAALSPAQQATLNGIARDTWRSFERSVSAADRHLPPDNLQTDPHEMLAHRTSPTNIGLYLLSAACARAFGWIGTVELTQRLEATLTTLDSLQRHRGHFYNWYETTSGAPLLPMYVSTVDSGNLSGHLLALAQACRAWCATPLDAQASRGALQAARTRLLPLLAQRQRLSAAQRAELRWLLADHSATRRSAALDARAAAAAQAPAITAQLKALARRCEQLAWQADFGFLYHPQRHLLHIGYRVAEQELDAGFYDLLASESRLTSLLAIAKGDVPVQHWAALGRPFYALGGHAGLRSWSGSMFEYLMPTLVLAEPQGSVLREACQVALQEQCAFAAAQQMPWGMSESAYAGRDHTLAYQYAPQGVPRLALRRAPQGERVVAPYATALAAQLAPRQALRNFAQLQSLQPRARYGFIEALDFTAERQAEAPPPASGSRPPFMPVHTHMAHHQGMSIVALANVLLGGVAQRWGMGHPHIEAVSSLLHERAPREVSLLSTPPSGPALRQQAQRPGLLRELVPGALAVEPTQLLSNGRYSVTLRANGAGFSQWRGVAVNRWRDDALRDAYGSFIYLRAGKAGIGLASITQHPAPDPATQYRATFHADRVCFDAHWVGLQAHTTVWVSPEDDIEFRQVELRNLGDTPLVVELISAFEVTLTEARADEAHPAFSNLFVQAQWQAEQRALRFTRKPRLQGERSVQMAHFVAFADTPVLQVRQQTDRALWLGRNRGSSQPLAQLHTVDADGAPSDASPTGLDPVCALAVTVSVPAHGKVQLTWATAVSDNGGTLSAIIDKYRQASHVARSSLMSATLAGIRLRALRIGAQGLAVAQTLCTALLFTLARKGVAATGFDRRALWRLGISGDRALIVITLPGSDGLPLVRALAQTLRWWAWGGVACDLVCINSEPASYQMALQHELLMLRNRHAQETEAEMGSAGSTALHVLRSDEVSAPEWAALHGLARIRWLASGRPLHQQVQDWALWHEQALDQRDHGASTALPLATQLPVPRTSSGQFVPGSGEFRFEAGSTQRPPRPWINVLANPGFGTQVSEAGGGCTWAGNSRLNQLTAWSNDPVADAPVEWFLIQDLRNRTLFSALPSAFGATGVEHSVTHRQGSTHISHRNGDLEVSLVWCVDADSAIKQVQLTLVNHGSRSLPLRLVALAEWMMGSQRGDRASTLCSAHHQRLPGEQALTALLCTQLDAAGGFGGGTAFLSTTHALGDDAIDWSCDRRECFDARGRPVVPDHWAQRSGSAADPCAALAVPLLLRAGQSHEQVFLLGWAVSADHARQLATSASAVQARLRLQQAHAGWDTLLGATEVLTPDPLFDALVNRWLLYQTLSCRLWAKAGFYQAGGATGFRDQLQDTMALAWAAPHLLREQILRSAARQYSEGDVQHWWHSPGGAGVRTRFSDDLLWLPLAILRHLQGTGEHALLDESVPFIDGPELAPGAEDLYSTPTVSSDSASLFEHAARAIDRSLRVGAHGLPLMGGGDWNDGMNRIGIEGRGESVWLAWFLCVVVAGFAPLARARGEPSRADRWLAAAEGWRSALMDAGWDGQWFKRAFFDDGTPLGSHTNSEARIDLMAQTWAVLSQAAPLAWQRMALHAVHEQLVDEEQGLVRLLHPPLQDQQPSAGYIQAYPPGVRENGGQYSHGAVWLVMAHARYAHAVDDATQHQSHADLAWQAFTWLSPAHRAAHPSQGPRYGLEPYVMAGDVSAQAPYAGRGGWSWYTGAAGWMHRAAVESILGLQWSATELSVQPCLPSHWPQAELVLRRDGRTLRFVLLRGDVAQARALAVSLRARLLWVGSAVAWPALAPGTHGFVVPLPGGSGSRPLAGADAAAVV